MPVIQAAHDAACLDQSAVDDIQFQLGGHDYGQPGIPPFGNRNVELDHFHRFSRPLPVPHYPIAPRSGGKVNPKGTWAHIRIHQENFQCHAWKSAPEWEVIVIEIALKRFAWSPIYVV